MRGIKTLGGSVPWMVGPWPCFPAGVPGWPALHAVCTPSLHGGPNPPLSGVWLKGPLQVVSGSISPPPPAPVSPAWPLLFCKAHFRFSA